LIKTRFTETPHSCVAVHCMAGLGRAPLLVALALMEAGVPYTDAVADIREKRRGAINTKQLLFLEKYRSKDRLRAKWFKWFKKNISASESCCIQ
ncbi:protein-tyrosine phosphatase family protein, partial [Salmonella sp. s55004]|uniref:protein-tyrosine phosphatase family protein n=1 Tax=Salmonella sp. s55004 TaxID=3159675 RepID=UPI00398018EF